MTRCNHTNLALIPGNRPRARCRHCHLTIEVKELGDGYCPECFESSGRKHYAFEPVATDTTGPSRYRCEDCGVVIEA
ncbi:MAG: hypothetical protein SWC96_07205 [Thermodesulfobacteriota bacterium]|nr:hypothetical protein [Thermodesulfobacteriota bacterium]